jgi:hypothetical protein
LFYYFDPDLDHDLDPDHDHVIDHDHDPDIDLDPDLDHDIDPDLDHDIDLDHDPDHFCFLLRIVFIYHLLFALVASLIVRRYRVTHVDCIP